MGGIPPMERGVGGGIPPILVGAGWVGPKRGGWDVGFYA